MNLNKGSVRILCYGDSNTWGYIPASSKRHPIGVRWTSLLQEKLGNSYEVIEEGLNSRTTDLDDPKHIGKNGKTYLVPCLQSHDPINLVILMLGTNDLKERFHRSPEQVVASLEDLIKIIQETEYSEGLTPKILLMAPPIIDESVKGVKEKYLGAEVKSRQFENLFGMLAKKYNLPFLNLADYVSPSKKDGYHLDESSHKTVSKLLYEAVLEALK